MTSEIRVILLYLVLLQKYALSDCSHFIVRTIVLLFGTCTPDVVLMVRPPAMFLFMNIITADQALKLALGSTVISLWVIFFAIAVLVSLVGIHQFTGG